MMLPHWPCFTLKFFMVCFTKFLDYFFRSTHNVLEIYVLAIEENYLTWQLSWKFSWKHLKNNRLVSFYTASGRPGFLNFYFDLGLPFYFLTWNRYFSVCENSCRFPKHNSVFFQSFHHSSLLWHKTPLLILRSYIFYFGQNDPIKVPVSRLSTGLVKNYQIPQVIFQTKSQSLFKFCITLQCHER